MPVENVIVFSETGKHLGISNRDGYCLIGDSEKIRLTGLNIRDTTVKIDTYYDFSTVYVNKLTYELEEFAISDEKIDLKALLVEFMEKSHEKMLKKDTLLYYDFMYKVLIPDSNWKEVINGKLRVKIMPVSKKRVYARVFCCALDYTIDDSFLKSELYSLPINHLSSFSYINTNMMFNRQKAFKKGVEKYVDTGKLKMDGELSIFELTLKGADVNMRLKNKENYFFKDTQLVKQKYYSTVEGKTNVGINQFYKEVNYTASLPNYIESLLFKSVGKYRGLFFIKQFEIRLSDKKCEECMDKRIDYISWTKNYQEWVKDK